ncbi:hypothetical protein EDD11_006490 [Mortierella claussenii]|nr:hypothetical protein EDD11_006490 [Mortierella claussenii]
MWKTLVGKFQPLPASSYHDAQNERDLERSWDERDTTGVAGMPENATSQAELAQLRAAFFACMEAEQDQQRNRQFQVALQQFASIFGRQVSGQLVAESIHDIKAFTAMASAQLVQAIASVTEQKLSEKIASVEYMRCLRRAETFNALKAIDILSKAPDNLLAILAQQKVHSGLLAVFLNFVEFPSPDFEEPLSQSVASILVVSTLTNGLKRLLWRKPVISVLIEDDELYGLFEALVIQRNSNLGGDPAELYIWKARVMDVVDFVVETTETDIMLYLHSKDCAKLLSDALKEYLVDGSIDSVHREEGILILRIIVKLIKKSSLMSSVLLDDFKANKIYETLAMLLVSPPFDEDMLTFKYTIISLIEELVFIDKEALAPPEEGTPYQHQDFVLPVVGPEHAGAVVRNLVACQVLVTALLYPDISNMTLLPAGNREQNSPPNQFSLTVFSTLLSIIRDHPMNYFLLERLNILSYAIERLDTYHPELQSSVMELFTYVLKDLNYVPFRDLVILSIHFQGTSSPRTTALVCDTVASLLQTSPGFKDVLREVGLIDMFCNMLEELSVVIRETFGNPQFNNRISVIDFGKAFNPGESKPRKYGIEVVHHFNSIMGCLVELLRGSRSNIALFQSTFRGDLFSLLHYNETRDGILRVIVVLVVESYRFFLEDKEASIVKSPPTSNPGAQSQKTLSAPYQLTQLCEILQSLNRYDFKMKMAILNALNEVFLECPELKDVFREGGGYVSIVSLLIRLEDAYVMIDKFEQLNLPKRRQRRDPQTDERIPTKADMLELFTKVFSVLSESMREHPGNSSYFEEHIGFGSLADALQLTGVFGPDGDAASMLGILFAFATQNEYVLHIFDNPEEIEQSPEMVAKWLNSPQICIQNPHVVLGIWRICMGLRDQESLAFCGMMSLFALSCANRRNQVLMGQTALLDELLKALFDNPSLAIENGGNGSTFDDGNVMRDIMSRLAKRLIEMGMSSVGFRYLMEKFSATKEISFGECSGLLDMLLHGVTHSRWPSFVQFDGYSRLDLRSLGSHNFPPTSGYTFLGWLCIESFDEELAIQVLEISDEDRRCYLSIQIEPETHKLVVSVSHHHSVSFNFAFEIGRWYHLALVHAKPKLTIPGGSLSVYIDGILGDKIKCGYLSSPSGEVKAYLGRHQKPKMTAKREGSTLSWNLGPCYLVDEPLDVQIMDVLYNLSPRYHGNFQDSLGKFQTYETSTALNINLEAARRRSSSNSRNHEEQVALMNAIRGTIGNSIPEDKLVFAFSGGNLLDSADTRTVGAMAGIHQRDQFCKILFNSAIPRIHRGINPLSAIGILVGNPLVAAPRGLDDSIWKVGGCVVALRIVESAKDTATLEKAVLLLDQLIRCSWRNSEDMERIFGYEILGYILKQKKALFSIEMMNTLLSVVGMDLEYPDDSVITNSFAFRHLMLDMDIWKKTDTDIQLLHLEQFKIFLQHSHKSPLNVKRLSTMHVVKKMLAPLRTGNYPSVQLPNYVDAMKTVVFNHFSTETVRNLATFLVSTLKQTNSKRSLSVSSQRHPEIALEGNKASLNTDIVQDPRETPVASILKYAVIGNAIMEMLEQILCERGNVDYVHKFATTITNKWTLLFIENPGNPYGAVLAMRILARLLYTQGSAYLAKFKASYGFLVLQSYIPQFWNVVPMIHVVICILLGVDVCEVPLRTKFDNETLHTLYGNSMEAAGRTMCLDILPTLMAMLKNGVAAAVTPVNTSNSKMATADQDRIARVVETYQTLIEFFSEMQTSSRTFRDIFTRQEFVDDMAANLFPFICHNSKAMVVELELDYIASEPSNASHTNESSATTGVTADADATIARPVSGRSSQHSSISSFIASEAKTVDTDDSAHETEPTSVTSTRSDSPSLPTVAAVAVNAATPPFSSSSLLSSSSPVGSAGPGMAGMSATSSLSLTAAQSAALQVSQTFSEGSFRRASSNASLGRVRDVDLKIVQDPIALLLLRLFVIICIDSILDPAQRPLTVIDLVLQSCPPAYKDHQIYFQSFLLGHVVIGLEQNIQKHPEALTDSRVIANVDQFCELIVDLTCQGWFVGSYLIQFDMIANVLEIISQDINMSISPVAVSSLPLSSSSHSHYANMRPDVVRTHLTSLLYRLVCFTLGQCQIGTEFQSTKLEVLVDKCIYFQKILLSNSPGDVEFMKCLILHLFAFLPEASGDTRAKMMTLIKLVFLMRPVEASGLLRLKPTNPSDDEDSADEGYSALVEANYPAFVKWREAHNTELDMIFAEFRRSWDTMMSMESRTGEDAQRQKYNRRTQKLKRLFRRQHLERNILQQYKLKTFGWTRSIQDMEEVRYAKSLQDLDDHVRFVKNEWKNLVRDVCRKGAIWEDKESLANKTPIRWRLDFTEARSRMRRKLRVDERKTDEPYLPKQGGSSVSIDAKISSISIPKSVKSSPLPIATKSRIEELKEADVASVASEDKNADVKSDKDSIGDNNTAIQDGASTTGSETVTENEDGEADNENGGGETEAATTEDVDVDKDQEPEPAIEEAANRKILRLLEAGDVVYEVYNMSRVTGLDAVEGLLLLCKHNMYLIDNYFQKMDGEVVDISEVADSERDQYLQLLASNAPASQPLTDSSEVRHQCRKWRFEDIKEVHRRRYLLRNVALELFFVDGRNYLINLNLQQRDLVYNQLASRVGSLATNSLQMGERSAMVEPNSNNNQPQSLLGSKLANIFAPSSIADIAAKWERHEISNFQYLMHLNTMAGRTYNDLTQYPVFPWVLADYTSEELDLTDPKTFRDLSRPMGAQTPDREKDFNDRYHTWDGGDDRTPPFHYGTHYSSAMIVCSYLIRLEPFTQEYLKLQGGQFDHADRLFHSIGKSWISASQKTMSDVRELIPEFFYLPEFLMNTNGFNFGTLQTTGEQIDHVKLPPWAKDDPKIFIEKHREALECDYVSAHLHEWIDLIFGYKQQGPESVRAVNVFHHMSYEGAIDLDTIDDHIQKSATIGIIHNFGQTPRQLFKKPHGPRLPPNKDPLSHNYYNLANHAEYLTQSVIPIKDIGLPVGEIIYQSDKPFVGHSQRAYEPYACSKYVEWGFSDNSVRLYLTETSKILGIFENLHLEAITCVKWADDRTIVTTSRDTVVCIWRIVHIKSYELKLMKCLRGHRETVHTVAISVAYSIIVSGSEDKSCIVWDLNRLEYVRQLGKHEDGVRVVAINDATGDIATCSGPVLRLWTVNGDLILQKYTTQIGDPILDCVFYAGRTGEWVPREIIFTSHRRGVVKVWEKAVVDADFQRNSYQLAAAGSLSSNGAGSRTLSNMSMSSLQQSLETTSISQSTSLSTTTEDSPSMDGVTAPSTSFAAGENAMVSSSVAGEENDSATSGSRSRQSSHTTSTGASSGVPGDRGSMTPGGGPTGMLRGQRITKWALRLRQAYTYEDRLRVDGGVVPNIVSLYVSSARRALYTGDSLGRVHIWALPDGSGCTHWMQPGRDTVCVNCQTRFPLLERKFNCRTCGGVFCGTCTFVPLSGFAEKQARFCFKCSGGKLKELMG